MSIHVREKPPLRLHELAIAPSGRRHRWGDDEPNPANAPSARRLSSTMPGGFETHDAVLPRKPGVDYQDLKRLTTIQVLGVGGEVAGEYRLERAPKVSGDQMAISPSAVGGQAYLEDDKSARMIYVDRDVSQWHEPPASRRLALANAGVGQGRIQASVDDGGLSFVPPNEALATNEEAELNYDAGSGQAVAKIMYRGKRVGAFTNFETPSLYTSDTEDFAAVSGAGLTLDDTTRTLAFGTAARFVLIRAYLLGAGVTPGLGWLQRLTQLALYGNHGLTTRAISGETDGLLASDIWAHAIRTWAPSLQFTEGPDGTIQPSSFVIPHAAYHDPTTAGEIGRQANRFELRDWAVWEDGTFWLHDRGARGRKWRARIGPAKLEETGPQIDRLWESVIVSYQDVDGTTRTVGPPGSGADTEDAQLKDTDPANPANELGIIRRNLLAMGTSTAAGATEVGARFLEAQKLLDTSGRATLVGHVEDDRGVLHPAWKVRAGDQVSFEDSNDPSYRRIVKADYDDDARACSVDLDSPPEGLAALLERLGVVLIPLGLS